MSHRQGLVLETFRQLRVFLDANAAAANSVIASLHPSLDDVVNRLTSRLLTMPQSTLLAAHARRALPRGCHIAVDERGLLGTALIAAGVTAVAFGLRHA